MEPRFPIILDMKDVRCVVVGGGKVAERKISSLLKSKAAILVISPQVTEQIAEWAGQDLLTYHSVTWHNKEYDSTDLEGALFVFAVTDSPEVNKRICHEALQRGLWVNAAHHVSSGNMMIPATVRRGKLLISVSTSGASPGLSKKLLKQIEQQYGDPYERLLEFLYDIRQVAQQLISDPKQRYSIYKVLLDQDHLQSASTQQLELLKQRIVDWIELSMDHLDIDELYQLLEAGGKS